MIKHKAGIKNQVADALSRKVGLLLAVSVEVVGFEKLKEDYENCSEFSAIIASLGKGPSREYS